ncbi:MAG: hypothetical protein J2P29_08945 [Actinobacteria bacterium]|nr:hypothetical protein [Candidatus Dormibacteraeota bacterium]MBO0832081.1 hypothetical protein [Actinomycetota bacterium]
MTSEFRDDGAGRGDPTDEVPEQEPGPEPVSHNPKEIEVPKLDEGEGAG